MAARPPLTLAAFTPRHWECITCSEDFSAADPAPYKTEEGHTVCPGCIRKIFERSDKFEIDRPARWGNTELNIRNFERLFGEFYVARYENRRLAAEARRLQLTEQRVENNAPPGFVRGRDYQLCPTCKNAISLRDGCNHIICPCMMSFCFICGKEALDGSDHWVREGGCPRYNQPGTREALYDDDDLDEEVERFAPPTERRTQFSFAIWAWNTTMQTMQDQRVLSFMQRLIGMPVPDDRGEIPDRMTQVHAIFHAMIVNRDPDRVSEEAWELMIQTFHERMVQFVRSIVFRLAPEHVFPTRNGVLTRPVGGVFNMVSTEARRQAYNWAYERQQAYQHWNEDDPRNYAIFDVGPSGTPDEIIYAKELMKMLLENGSRLTEDRMDFVRINHATGYTLLVKLIGEGTNNPLRGVAPWLIVPPPVRRALNSNMPHTPEQRQQSARIEANWGTIRTQFERQEHGLVPWWVPLGVVLSEDDMYIPDNIDSDDDDEEEDDFFQWDFLADARQDDQWPFWEHGRNMLRRVSPRRRREGSPDQHQQEQGRRRNGDDGPNAVFGFGAGL